MERIFIDREWCINYTLLALDSISNSNNEERTIEEFIEEMKIMFNSYTDENQMMKIRKNLIKKLGKKKLLINNN